MDSSDVEQGPIVGLCLYGTELAGFIKHVEFLSLPRDCKAGCMSNSLILVIRALLEKLHEAELWSMGWTAGARFPAGARDFLYSRKSQALGPIKPPIIKPIL